MDNSTHPIEQYYRDIEARRRKALEELEQARERGADSQEIARLEDKALWAGYTGD